MCTPNARLHKGLAACRKKKYVTSKLIVAIILIMNPQDAFTRAEWKTCNKAACISKGLAYCTQMKVCIQQNKRCSNQDTGLAACFLATCCPTCGRGLIERSFYASRTACVANHAFDSEKTPTCSPVGSARTGRLCIGRVQDVHSKRCLHKGLAACRKKKYVTSKLIVTIILIMN
jgi:hypothetical protein